MGTKSSACNSSSRNRIDSTGIADKLHWQDAILVPVFMFFLDISLSHMTPMEKFEHTQNTRALLIYQTKNISSSKRRHGC